MELLDQSTSLPTTLQKSNNVNLKKEIARYLKEWKWFLLSMLLFFAAAKVYLRYAEPQFLSKTSLKLQESKNKNTALSDMKNLGMGIGSDAELQGETSVIISKPLLNQVAKNLNLDVAFYSQGKIKEVELYNDSPLNGKIISLKNPSKFNSASYIISPSGKGYFRLLKDDNLTVGKSFRFGHEIDIPIGKIIIDVKPGHSLTSPIKVIFKNINTTVAGLENNIVVNLPENKGLLMELSMVGPVPQKSEDILNELTRQYNIDGIKDKNQEAQGTQDFINERLNIIAEDLGGIENQKEDFKRRNEITDLEAQANIVLTNANEDTKNLFNYSTQLELINSIYNIASSGSEQLIPSNIGLPSGIEESITKYNELVLTRNRVLKQATSINPSILNMNKDIAGMKGLIRKDLDEARGSLNTQLSNVKERLNISKDRINKYPTQEKIFRSIERQQTLKEQLYLYLLQKREENAITLAVTAPKAKVIDPAYTAGKVKPNNTQITYGALAIGFLLPLLFFIGKNVIDTQVHSKENIFVAIPNAMVIAEIPISNEQNAVVHPNDFSVFAESFRILASNLKFLLKTKLSNNKGVILVTSSIKGEGKTTIAMNTALTLAGKSKVILLGVDIRNPQLHRFIDGKNIGLTDYLVSEESSPDKYINKSGLSENLDVMFSGAIAPNPNDLLDMKKFDDMIDYLKNKYDYIVIDSAPVMLVSDTLHLVENADALLYVVKSNFTDKDMLNFAEEFRRNNHIKNMAFVLNNVSPENTRYGKKYGYGYYSYGRSKEKKGLRKFFK